MIGALIVDTEYFMILIIEQLVFLACFVYEITEAIGIFIESLDMLKKNPVFFY